MEAMAAQTRLGDDEGSGCLPIKVEFQTEAEERTDARGRLTACDSAAQQPSPTVRRTTRKPQITQRIWHLDIVDSAFRRWRQVGAARGLSSDSEIASFLIQHYEDTLSGCQSATHCSSCHSLLALTCTTCNPFPANNGHCPQQNDGAASPRNAHVEGSENASDDEMAEEGSIAMPGDKAGGKQDGDFQIPGQQTHSHGRRTLKRKSGPFSSSSPAATASPPSPPPPSPPPPSPPPPHERPDITSSSRSQQSLGKKFTSVCLRPPLENSVQTSGSAACLKPPTVSRPVVDELIATKKSTGLKRTLTPKRCSSAYKLSAKRKQSDSDTQGTKRSHICGECGATFSRKGGLKVHMRIHTGEKPYKCEECGMSFNQTVSLIVHKRKHSGERPYVCTECGSSFPLASTLKQHSRIHSGERPFSCQHCYKTFSRSGDLNSHLRVHTGLRPFLCQDCGKRFASSSDLTKHKRTHTGDRPFECPECHKKFPFPHRLTAHMRSHTGDKPYLCTVCGAAFARASNLTVHFRIHTGDKPFKCEECGKCFSDSGNLCKHRRTSHGGLGRKVGKARGSEQLVFNGGSADVHLSAVPEPKMFDTETVSLGVSLSSMSVPEHQLLPETVPPPLPSTLDLNPTSLVTWTADRGNRNCDPVHSQSYSSPTKQEPLGDVSPSLASTNQNSASQFISLHSSTAPRSSMLSPLFDKGSPFGEGSEPIPAEGTDRRGLKCTDCPASFPDPAALNRHLQTQHGSGHHRFVAGLGEGGGGGQVDRTFLQGTRGGGSGEEDRASLLPYFSASALGYYTQQ